MSEEMKHEKYEDRLTLFLKCALLPIPNKLQSALWVFCITSATWFRHEHALTHF